MVLGDLSPEPWGWVEGLGLLARLELNLRSDQAVEPAAVHVDLGSRIADRGVEPALVEPCTLRGAPESAELRLAELDLHLEPLRPRPSLQGQEAVVTDGPQPQLGPRADHEVALLDLLEAGTTDLPRRGGHQELSLDLLGHFGSAFARVRLGRAFWRPFSPP